MAVKTYDPKQITVIIGGTIVTGFADSTFVSIERNEDAFALEVGAYGDATRVKSNNRSGRFTFTLQQTSSSNQILAALALADEEANAGVVPVMVKDLNGTTLATGAESWIVKVPNTEFSTDISGREWILETDVLALFVGGN